MTRSVVFRSVSGISCDMGVKPSPGRSPAPHLAFYTGVLGFALARRDEQSAALERDGVRIEFVVTPNHDPATSGACFLDVSNNVESLRQESPGAGSRPGPIAVQQHGDQRFRLFFLKEDYDGYCFCFGQPLRRIRDILSL